MIDPRRQIDGRRIGGQPAVEVATSDARPIRRVIVDVALDTTSRHCMSPCSCAYRAAALRSNDPVLAKMRLM